MKDLSRESPKTGGDARAAAERLATLGPGAFVGRTAELEHLKAALEAALAGRARPVFVTGEAGIGKTRLFERFAEHAATRGARVLSGRCHGAASVPAYWPWLQVIRASIGSPGAAAHGAEPVEDGDITSLVPQARKRPPTLAAAVPGEARFRLFNAVSVFLRRASRVRPLLIVIDDLHCADEPSVALLEFLARESGDARVLIVGTYRDVELAEGHPLRQVASSLQHERLVLDGLRREDVRSLLGTLAGADMPCELVDAIHQKTGGNPFYVEEMTRQLVQDDRIRPEAGVWRARSGWETLRLSEPVRETLRGRFALLSPSSRQVLVAASVLGLEFTFQDLERVAHVPHDRLLQVLEEALVLRMVVEVSPGLGRYRFAHALLQETLYAEPALAVRLELHARAAVELEASYGEAAESHPAVLAHHFLRALPLGDAERAIFYSEKAGDLAVDQFAYERAAHHYEQALEVLDLRPEAGGRRRCALLIRLGNAQWRSGETSRAQETFPQAADLARALRAPELLAESALGLGFGLGGMGVATGPDPLLIDLLEEALEALGESDGPLRARLLARLAVELYYTPFAERRSSLSEEAVKMAERLGDTGVRLAALCSRHLAALGPDFGPEGRVALADEILTVARRVGEREVSFRARGFRLAALLEAGDASGVETELRACEALASELRQPFARWQVAVFQAMKALLEGRPDDGARLALEAFEIGREVNAETALSFFTAQTGVACWMRGEVEGLAEKAQAFAQRYPWVSTWRATVAFCHAEVGRDADARSELEFLARSDFSDLPRDGYWLYSCYLLSLTAATLRDERRCEILYRALLPYAARNVVLTGVCFGPVALPLGILAAALGNLAEAAAHFESALERGLALRAKPTVARTLCEHANVLLRAGSPAEREQALSFLDRALEVAAQAGMQRLAAAIETRRANAREHSALGAPEPPAPVFRKEGDFWEIGYEGRTLRFRDSKGLQYMAELARHPGREFHVFDLAAGVGGSPAEGAGTSSPAPVVLGDAGALLDTRARNEYRRRLEEISFELHEAEEWSDRMKESRLREEMDMLAHELSAAYGLGGRQRKAADVVERIRKAVSNRIRDSIARIQGEHPALGTHFANAVRTGTFCCYAPEKPVVWTR